MWMETLFEGVLRVLTPLGPRYVKPSFSERLYLLWIFRNFHTLPVKVLSSRQQRWIENICTQHGFISLHAVSGSWEARVVGTLEQRPPVEVADLPARRPNQSVTEAVPQFAADVQQQ